ncbi:PhzF family phenazine biosynthesis protein [Pelagibius marinus]|uniref:PhzF family phenazine biosynthesis protein n=1 Tax=Pelagibius marinus TaxID=2762760 RepID=UPI0029CA3EA3|nr:PhzF family phenazine biosynthesis protein [Pelagibius marinus]
MSDSAAPLSGLNWLHADVFCDAPLTGNGLCVFLPQQELSAAAMLALTQEMRQFESIFLSEVAEGAARARIFTLEEELDFAGHPLLGAAAVLHHAAGAGERHHVTFRLTAREVAVATRRRAERFFDAEMAQGPAVWGGEAEGAPRAAVISALGLQEGDLVPGLPLAAVSTGLDYLIVPVTSAGLARAAIRVDDFEARLAALGAKFVYVLDPEAREGRTWDNLGAVEDVATGSAAGPAGAYLHRYCNAPAAMTLHQGRFAGRPSRLSVTLDKGGNVTVGGGVSVLAEGRFF